MDLKTRPPKNGDVIVITEYNPQKRYIGIYRNYFLEGIVESVYEYKRDNTVALIDFPNLYFTQNKTKWNYLHEEPQSVQSAVEQLKRDEFNHLVNTVVESRSRERFLEMKPDVRSRVKEIVNRNRISKNGLYTSTNKLRRNVKDRINEYGGKKTRRKCKS